MLQHFQTPYTYDKRTFYTSVIVIQVINFMQSQFLQIAQYILGNARKKIKKKNLSCKYLPKH